MLKPGALTSATWEERGGPGQQEKMVLEARASLVGAAQSSKSASSVGFLRYLTELQPSYISEHEVRRMGCVGL